MTDIKNTLEKNIPDSWTETTLGGILEKRGYIRGPFGSALKRSEMKEDGIPVYEQANAINNHRIFRYFIDDKKHDELKRFTVRPKDILISCSGTLGKITQIKSSDPIGIISQALLILRANNQIVDINYLEYFLNSREGQYKLLGASHGSVQVNIAKRADVEKIDIILPPLPEQHAIADTLSSFDDKIELLADQNDTLEKTAQTIFKEWFGKYSVDRPEELLQGWRVGKITEIIERESISYKCTKKDLSDTGTTKIFDQGSDGLYGYTEREPDFIASSEDPVILFTNHTCNYWFVDYPFCAIQNVIPYRGKDGYDQYFIYFMTKGSIQFIEYKGHWPDFEAKDFVIPSVEESQKFSKIAKPILDKISTNKIQIRSLEKTRDTLLPKLMRGDLRVNLKK